MNFSASSRPNAATEQDLPPFFAPSSFNDAAAAVEQARLIYEAGLRYLQQALRSFMAGVDVGRVRACYPMVRIRTQSTARPDSRLAYGFVAGPGLYETTLTRPDLFASYLQKQFELLMHNHGVALEIGTSHEPIPLHFALSDHDHVEGQLSPERRRQMADVFDLPDLAAMDDGIANGSQDRHPAAALPLALFTAPRIDYSLQRLRHYTGSSADHFQNFVLFTNYPFYIDEFVRLGRELMQQPPDPARPSEFDDCIGFVEPGNVLTPRVGCTDLQAGGQVPPRLPQMPGYHLLRRDHSGVTMINIGVGPANAKTMSDHVAVLRPHAWLMLGHCAGLSQTQALGDYVLAHGYVREDHVLDEELPLWVPIPPLAEIQKALEQAVADVTQLSGWELKHILRTGTVASTDNRNWELLPHPGPERRFSQSRAVALDMESATIAGNGFRFRVPYGTLLCVSDKPLHGEIKLPGMADQFYRARVDQHLRIGLRAVELLRGNAAGQLHSRKLRSFAEVAFQ
jgi:AMP nucleosidase